MDTSTDSLKEPAMIKIEPSDNEYDQEKSFPSGNVNIQTQSFSDGNSTINDEDSKAYRCYNCKCYFASDLEVKSHMLIHTAERPFECGICGECFVDAESLKMHVLVMHVKTENTKHECTFCKQSFDQLDLLNKHLLLHSGNKPHVCHICNKEFARERGLKIHMHIHDEHKQTAEISPQRKSARKKRPSVKLVESGIFEDRRITSSECENSDVNINTSMDLSNIGSDHSIKIEDVTSLFLDAGNNIGETDKQNSGVKEETINSNERPFGCYICNATFEYNTQLEAHVELHAFDKNKEKQKLSEDVVSNIKLEDAEQKTCGTHDSQGSNLTTLTQIPLSSDSFGADDSADSQSFYPEDSMNETGASTSGKVDLSDRPFRCPMCPKGCKTKAHLKDHILTHTREKPYGCDICGKRFVRKNYAKHHRLKHLRKGDNHVEEDYISGDEESVIVKNMKCSTCYTEFTCQEDLDKHVLSHSDGTNKEEEKECKLCGKIVSSAFGYEQHLAFHSGERPHACTMCERTFRNIHHLTDHLTIHTGERRFRCNICDRRFRRRHELKNHKLDHNETKQFPCPLCDKSFNLRPCLKTHLLIHKGEKPHECNICNRRFRQKSTLKLHLQWHTGERNVKCHICGKGFFTGGALRVHLLTHTGEKPHVCEECGMQFRVVAALNKHRIKAHSGVKAHECSICGKRFSLAIELKAHSIVHTNEKPFLCSLCGKGFKVRKTLVQHLKVHQPKPHTNASNSIDEVEVKFSIG